MKSYRSALAMGTVAVLAALTSPAFAADLVTSADIALAQVSPVKSPLPTSKTTFAKDEADVAANDKLILEEARLSDDKAMIAKADELVARDKKVLALAQQIGPDPKVLSLLESALKTQTAFQPPLLAFDRKVELERDNAPAADKYDVAMLPGLGPVLALPTEIAEVDFWKRAAASAGPVMFYDEKGVDFEVDPQEVLKVDEILGTVYKSQKATPEFYLQKAFDERGQLYKDYGEAGLLGDLLYIQTFDKAANFKADARVLDRLIVNDIDAPVSGVPEPATWAMMLVGVAGMGAVLRRRRCVQA